jgi:hypothetical protein
VWNSGTLSPLKRYRVLLFVGWFTWWSTLYTAWSTAHSVQSYWGEKTTLKSSHSTWINSQNKLYSFIFATSAPPEEYYKIYLTVAGRLHTKLSQYTKLMLRGSGSSPTLRPLGQTLLRTGFSDPNRFLKADMSTTLLREPNILWLPPFGHPPFGRGPCD